MVDEVVDVVGILGDGYGVVDVGEGYVEGVGFFVVDF